MANRNKVQADPVCGVAVTVNVGQEANAAAKAPSRDRGDRGERRRTALAGMVVIASALVVGLCAGLSCRSVAVGLAAWVMTVAGVLFAWGIFLIVLHAAGRLWEMMVRRFRW